MYVYILKTLVFTIGTELVVKLLIVTVSTRCRPRNNENRSMEICQI